MNKWQRGNLEKLCAFVEALPDDYKHFDMRNFSDYDESCDWTPPSKCLHTCGTAGCFIGHGPQAGIKPKIKEDWHDYSERVIGFVSGSDEWEWLFGGGWAHTDNSPKGAAARGRFLLSNELPDDAFEQMCGDAPLCYKTEPQS